MNCTRLFNLSIDVLPPPMRLRRWLQLGESVAIAPRQLLALDSERVDGGPRTLVLRLTTPTGAHELRDVEALSFYTTEAVIRAVVHGAHGVERALVDIGELVTAPAWRREGIA